MAGAISQAQVFSEFTQVAPEVVAAPLLPHIVGPQAILHRYTVAAEKALISLGAYIPAQDTGYAWPDQKPGSVIDEAYFALFIDDAWLQYYTHAIGVGSVVAPVNGFPNEIKTADATYGYKANGDSYPRFPALGDRDVQVGDIITLNIPSNTLITKVNALIANVIAASTGSATADAGNAPSQSASSSGTFTGGTSNDVTLSATTGTVYNGLATGNINEGYTVTVTQGSVGGDATTALFSIVSASGLDNVASIAPSAFGSPTNVGTRGLTATWTHTSNDFVVGQQWTIQVHQAFSPSTPASSGTYTGTVTQTYIITVSLGGKFTDSVKPQISVTTNLGLDRSGPTTVTASASNVAVGSLGVQIEFTGAALNKGDIYYVVATAPGLGAYQTIQLADNMNSAFRAASDIAITLNIQENIVVPQQAIANPPNLNWAISQVQITVNSGLEATDPSLTNNGAQFYVPVVSSPTTEMYAQYREWIATYFNTINTIQVPTTTMDPSVPVVAALGVLSPDNPLCYAVYLAVLNSNGQPVNYSAVGDPAVLENWTLTFDMLEGLLIYSVVPLSYDPAVLSACKSFVDTQSANAAAGGWVRAWFNLQVVDSEAIVDQALTTNDQVAEATLTANPNILQTQYTYLTCTTGNVQFQTVGVLPGDVVRYLYTVDSFGNPTYTSFIVAQVVNQATLIVQAPGNGSAITGTQKFEIWRTYNANQIATNLAAEATAVGDARILYVWPDIAETTLGEVDGYFLCAAYAGFTAGILPHQGLQGIPIQGFLSVNRSTNFFSNGQLNILAGGGVFVITQDSLGNVFCRNALTTDLSSPQNKLEVVQRNDDTIQHVLFNSVSAFFGVANNTTAGLSLIESELQSAAQTMLSSTFVARLGDMITSFSILQLRQDLVNPDNVIVQLAVERPFPVDTLTSTFQFSVTESGSVGTGSNSAGSAGQ